jgi:hypothetical protein
MPCPSHPPWLDNSNYTRVFHTLISNQSSFILNRTLCFFRHNISLWNRHTAPDLMQHNITSRPFIELLYHMYNDREKWWRRKRVKFRERIEGDKERKTSLSGEARCCFWR